MPKHKKLLIALLDLLVDRLLEHLDDKPSAQDDGDDEGEPGRRKKVRRKKRARNVGDSQLLELLREQGPLSTAQTSDLTGLGESALSKKFARLKKAKAVQQVKSGRNVLYKATRGNKKVGGRKTSPKKKAGKKATAKRSDASTAAEG